MQNTTKHPGSNIVYTNTSSFTHPEKMLILDTTYCSFVTGGEAGIAIINGYDISSLPPNTPITGYRVIMATSIISSSNTLPSFRLVTGITQNASTYTSIGDSHRINRNTETKLDSSSIYEYTFEQINSSNEEIIWLNNNLQTVLTGQNFGIRLYLADIAIAISYVALELLYGGTNLYIGNKNATEVYVGNTKTNAVYLGNNQIL